MFPVVIIDGEPVSTVDTEDLETVMVSLNENGDNATHRCSRCGQDLEDMGTDGMKSAETGSLTCNEKYSEEDDEDGAPIFLTHIPEAVPLTWCNSARVTLDESDDAVRVAISVGDPRGAFQMTIRKLPDGRLMMHLPHPSDPAPHAPLTEMHGGTYQIAGL